MLQVRNSLTILAKYHFIPNVTDELTNLETLPGPLLVDNMSNEASRAFGSFPDRLYIVLDGKIVYMVCILN